MSWRRGEREEVRRRKSEVQSYDEGGLRFFKDERVRINLTNKETCPKKWAMGDFEGRGSGKRIEEGIEEYIRQNTWQSEVGDGLFGRTPPAEIGEGGSFSPLQSKERR